MSCKATRPTDRAKEPSGERHLFLAVSCELESCSFTSQTPNVAGERCNSWPGEERWLLPSKSTHSVLAHASLSALAGGLSPPPSPQGSPPSNRRVLPSDLARSLVGGRLPRSCEAQITSLSGCTRPGSAPEPEKIPHSGCLLPCGISMGRTRRDIAHSLAWVLRSARIKATWPASWGREVLIASFRARRARSQVCPALF